MPEWFWLLPVVGGWVSGVWTLFNLWVLIWHGVSVPPTSRPEPMPEPAPAPWPGSDPDCEDSVATLWREGFPMLAQARYRDMLQARGLVQHG
jgi:hypothetical protein